MTPGVLRACILACLALRAAALEVPDAVVALPIGADDGETWGGSAVVVSDSGEALTLAEALPGTLPPDGHLKVVLPGGGRTTATIIRRGSATTAVLLQIDGWQHRPALRTTSPGTPLLGTTVWTVANSCGSIEQDGAQALSCGIISGAYSIPADAPAVRGRMGRVLSSYRGPVLETDAAVNDGSQGGALVDDQGRLLGLISLGQTRDRHLGTVVPIGLILGDLALAPAPAPATGSPTTTAVGPGAAAAAEQRSALAQAALGVQGCLALIHFERPAGLGNPDGVPRPPRMVLEVPAYDRERLQRWWDVYYQQQQVFYTDQPSPAIIIDAQTGLLITAASNLHGEAKTGLVLLGADDVPCQVVAVNRPLDLALVKAGHALPGSSAHFVSGTVRTGEDLALVSLVRSGGQVGLTMTRGVVSAVGRHLAQSPHSFLQISARANYGSLGGAVVDSSGALIGMSSCLFPQASWLINSGVGMALDGAEIAQALVALKAGTSTEQLPTLGLGVALKQGADGHPVIGEVIHGTGAEAAGLMAGDVIEKVDGVVATSHTAISRALLRHHAGESVAVEYLRAGKPGSCQVAVSEFNAQPAPPQIPLPLPIPPPAP